MALNKTQGSVTIQYVIKHEINAKKDLFSRKVN